jgi:hypothetical protein
MKRNIKIRRKTQFLNIMEDHRHGGYVPYTDYCQVVSQLNKQISRLQKTIVRDRMKDLGVTEEFTAD